MDGYNPLAVAAAVATKRELLEAGRGPVLLDTITYRLAGHSPSDAASYRTREEVSQWQEVDCLAGYGGYLEENELATASELEQEQARAADSMELVCRLAVSLEHSPRPDREARLIAGVMFSQPVAHRPRRRRAGAGWRPGGQPARGGHRQALAQRLRA